MLADVGNFSYTTWYMTSQFVHLHVHSQYSLLDASLSIQDLVRKAASLNMPAVALTDHGNLYGAIDFYKACKDAKIKAIIGCEMYIAPGSRLEKTRQSTQVSHVTLLAKNKTGYHNLAKLSSIGYLEGFYYVPRIDFETLAAHSDGLICLSGCTQGPLAREILNHGNVEKTLEQYQAIFKDDFYLELQRHNQTGEDIQLDGLMEESWHYMQYQEHIEKQKKVETEFLHLSKTYNIPLVATNNCHYLEREDYRAHEILINIQSGEPCEIWHEDSAGVKQFRAPNPKRSTFPSHEFYFKSEAEMQSLFHDIPEALTNTLLVAEKCDLKFDFSIKHYPVYHPPGLKENFTEADRKQAAEEYLAELCDKAIPRRYPEDKLKKVQEKYPEKDALQVVKDRLAYEMKIITSKDMCDYLLIVWDFIHWAKTNGIPMGPGRGSGAGSIICYLTGITDIEPLRFDLFFERFINPERLSYPDIDVDICMERRQEVINYTIQKYGRENVAQIITFGAMKAKMVIRDVGRTLSVALSKVNAIVKLVPEDLNITIDKALEKDADLKALSSSDQDAQKILDIGKRLEGCLRSTGIHAAGLIVSAKPLQELIPICLAKDSDMLATQYSMKPVETVGMLKIDFLGLKTLTSIEYCQSALRKKGISIDWTNLPLEDEKTFQLLNRGKTSGVFQLESEGMQDLAKNLHLDRFEEIIAVLSLYRPGPMDMIPSFIARKHKREPIEYDHPWMSEILSETYGIMVYQEQVMQIASRLANYSLGEGDVLRRAMGKKDMKEMGKQREKFLAGCLQNNILQENASRIFDKMEKFAEYGFNKSHAAAYGYLTYVTAYLKAHFGAEWLSALMTCDRDDITKIAKFTQEGREMGIPILPPDINESESHFVATGAGIRYAMSGIKGVGSNVVDLIVEERRKNGTFTSLYNFIKRIDGKKIGKKAVELLIDTGCFDFTGWHHDAMKASLEAMIADVAKNEKESSVGIMWLFDEEKGEVKFAKPPKLAALTPRSQQLFREKELLGFFLSGHPLDQYKELVRRLGCLTLQQVADSGDTSVQRSVFLIEEVSPRVSSKTQKKFAILTISDPSGVRMELPIWPELYEERQQFLVENRLILAILTKEKRNDEVQTNCKWIHDLQLVDENIAKECDTAYDKAKFQSKRPAYAAKPKKPGEAGQEKAEKSKEVVKEAPKCVLSVDLERVKHSDILRLQSMLQGAKRGSVPVEIRFVVGVQEYSTLMVDSKWAVDMNEEFDQMVDSLKFIV